jgi:hypothetical protein
MEKMRVHDPRLLGVAAVWHMQKSTLFVRGGCAQPKTTRKRMIAGPIWMNAFSEVLL